MLTRAEATPVRARTLRLIVVMAMVFAGAINLPANVAWADCGGGVTDRECNPPPVPPPDVDEPGPAGPDPVSQPIETCVWGNSVVSTKAFGSMATGIYVYYYVECTNNRTGATREYQQLRCMAGNCPTAQPPGAPPPPDPVVERDAVYAQVVPVPPTAVVHPDASVVGVPTFLEMPDDTVRTASDTGFYDITVTATLTEVLWSIGGVDRTCTTAGSSPTDAAIDAAFAAADGLIDTSSHCTMLFIDSSDGAALSGSARTVWDYSWTLNGADMGVFSTGVTSPAGTFTHLVREFQAVITD